MTKDDVYKVMEEHKEDIYIVGDGNKSFYFTDRTKALRFARRIGSKDIVMWDHHFYYDSFYWNPDTECFYYP